MWIFNNQRLFGTFGKSDNEEADANEVASVNYFISKLPLFPKLVRLHLENENFSKSSVYKLRKYYHFAKAWDTFLFWVPNLILLVEVLWLMLSRTHRV